MNPVVLWTIIIGGIGFSLLFIRTTTGTWLTILVITALVAFGYGVVATNRADTQAAQQRQRMASAINARNSYNTAVDVHNQCIEKVARSNGNTQQWLDVSNYLVERGLEDAATYIESRLPVNVPPIDPATCPPLPPGPPPTLP